MTGSGLDWLSSAYGEGFCLILAKGMNERDLMTRMGANPETARPMTRQEAISLELNSVDEGPILQYGTSDNWAFCLQCWGDYGMQPGFAENASKGSQAAVISRLESGVSRLKLAEDGVVTFDVDLSMLDEAAGSGSVEYGSGLAAYTRPDSGGAWISATGALRFLSSILNADIPESAVLENQLLSLRIPSRA